MLRIIIADDEFDIVELCRALITYPGAEIVGEACNGIELLKKIEELHPDVVITDICMPGMTGLELIERAKQEFPAINFIVMSGYTEFQYAQTALRFGVWDYLLKPLKKAELNRALEKLDHELGPAVLLPAPSLLKVYGLPRSAQNCPDLQWMPPSS